MPELDGSQLATGVDAPVTRSVTSQVSTLACAGSATYSVRAGSVAMRWRYLMRWRQWRALSAVSQRRQVAWTQDECARDGVGSSILMPALCNPGQGESL